MFDLESILNKIKERLEAKEEVLAGYLYGSYARGEQVKSSDIDIGVLLMPDFKYDLFYLGGLYSEFQALSNEIEIQTFIINDKSPLFRYKVISPRKILFCRDDNLRAAIEVKTMNEYFEVKPYLEMSYESTIRRAKERVYGTR